MKEYVKNKVTLSPFDISKPIHLHTDASNSGMGYILSQPRFKESPGDDHYRTQRNLITLGSCGLTPTQARYSTIEQEMLSIKWAIQKTEYYVRGSTKIHVFCDNRNIRDIFCMDMSEMKNDRLLKMREKISSYPIQVTHVKGSTHSMADKLSRYPNTKTMCPDMEETTSPSISSRSLRLQSSGAKVEDPHVIQVAKMAAEDDDYKYIIQFIKDKTRIQEVDKTSELSTIESDFQSLSVYMT